MNQEKVRVLGKLITREKLVQITRNYNKTPIYRKDKESQYSISIVIEPLSDLPDEFEEIKYFNCNTAYINKDYEKMDSEEIENDIKSKYITFYPQREIYTDGTVYSAFDPKIISEIRTEDDKDKKFIPLPYFDLDELKLSIEEFEDSILNNKILTVFPEISYDICQGMCIVKKHQEHSTSEWIDVYIYSNIEKIERKNEGIIIFLSTNEIKRFLLKPEKYDKEKILFDNWVDVRTKQKSNVVFVDVDKITEWDKKLNDRLINEKIENNIVEENSDYNKILTVEIGSKEVNFINCLNNNAPKFGLLYDKKDLINFHIAVKSSGLVILSGMSGTGKSKLINLYAKTLGLYDRFRMIPVSPAWTDDTDLLGYLDYKNMLYRPADTDLVNFLIDAQNNPEKLYMVCFDEMNLARVEHYFSQFISVLENSDDERYIQLYNSNLENRVYNSNIYPSKILVRKNVIFVGTVNVDESTFHFSDKVLDRANVIKLNMCSFNELAEVKKNIISEDIDEIDFNTKDFFEINNDSFTMTYDELSFLDELNSCLKENNPRMGIGYRVISQINQYLSAIPENIGYSRQEAFDSLVVQRILTKLRGADDQIIKLIGNVSEENKLENSLLYDLFEKYLNVSDFKHCKDALYQKAKELKLYGYTI